jgi:hypothetical protein
MILPRQFFFTHDFFMSSSGVFLYTQFFFTDLFFLHLGTKGCPSSPPSDYNDGLERRAPQPSKAFPPGSPPGSARNSFGKKNSAEQFLPNSWATDPHPRTPEALPTVTPLLPPPPPRPRSAHPQQPCAVTAFFFLRFLPTHCKGNWTAPHRSRPM